MMCTNDPIETWHMDLPILIIPSQINNQKHFK